MNSNVLDLPVELFTENSVGEYTGDITITIEEMIIKYLDNNGFFILTIDDKFEGYLDLFSVKSLKELNSIEYYNRSLKELVDKIPFKKNVLKKDDSLRKAKQILKQDVEFVPVLDNNKVIGRINENIVNRRVKKLLEHGFKLE